MVGRTLGHYRINSAIGAGGMGEVYRATDMKLGRDVALKILPPDFARLASTVWETILLHPVMVNA